MEIIQLNEEIKVKQDQLEVIVLIDYKHKSVDIFKHYEDKSFTSAEVLKYFDLIALAKKTADARLHPEKVEKEPARVKVKEGVKPVKPVKIHRNFAARVCTKCGEEYIPTGVRQQFCKKCK